MRAENAAGFRGVKRNKGTGKRKPFESEVRAAGSRPSADASASRTLAGYGQDVDRASSRSRASAAARRGGEGLTLVRAENARASGRLVPREGSKSKPFDAT